jgi:hypothetical protein
MNVPAADQPDFDMNSCVTFFQPMLAQVIAQEEKQIDDWLNSLKAGPMVIYPYAVNGDDYMAVWGLAVGQNADDTQAGIRVATWGHDVGAPTTAPVTMIAKAEFLYDTQTAADVAADAQWPDIASNVMWNPRWRARLRRVAAPMMPGGAQSEFESFVTGDVQSFASSNAASTAGLSAGLSRLFTLLGGYSGGSIGQAESAGAFLH